MTRRPRNLNLRVVLITAVAVILVGLYVTFTPFRGPSSVDCDGPAFAAFADAEIPGPAGELKTAKTQCTDQARKRLTLGVGLSGAGLIAGLAAGRAIRRRAHSNDVGDG